MSENQEKRMIADTGYEVIHAIRVGDREILAAENMNDPDGRFYFKAEYSELGFMAQYDRMIDCSSYISVKQPKDDVSEPKPCYMYGNMD